MRNQLFTRTTAVFAAMATVIILAFAAAMTVSAQADDPDWKVARDRTDRQWPGMTPGRC